MPWYFLNNSGFFYLLFLLFKFYIFSYITSKMGDITNWENVTSHTRYQLPRVTLLKVTDGCAMKSQGNIPHDCIHWKHKQQNTVSETEQQHTMQIVGISYLANTMKHTDSAKIPQLARKIRHVSICSQQIKEQNQNIRRLSNFLESVHN
jgi:hypothetical protein